MIEFDNYKVKINAFKPTLETIHSALKLDEARELVHLIKVLEFGMTP